MKSRAGKCLIAGIALAVLAAVFTVLVVKVDLQAIGPEDSEVGFATANGFFARHLSYNSAWYTITQAFGAIALITAAGFAFVGIIQLVQTKSLLKVDPCILGMGGFYLIVIGLYVLFEALALNYRPVDLGEGLEASYPSSHTMLVCCVMGMGILAIDRVFAGKWVRRCIKAAFAAVIVLTVAGRLLSGVHWFTDIVGGVLISASVILFYAAFYYAVTGRRKHSSLKR